MCTLSRCILVMSIIALALSTAACDSTSTVEPPSIEGIIVENDLLLFRPGDPLPSTALSVDTPNEEDVTFVWSASGGMFESTGTDRGAEGRLVSWQPDPRGGTYVITVEAARGESIVRDSTSIEVRPRPFGNWSGNLSLTDEEYEVARLCLFISSDDLLSQYEYTETRTSGGTSEGAGSSGGVLDSEQTYDYPTLSAHLDDADSDDFDEPVALTGVIAPEGTAMDVELEFESGKTRTIALQRTAAFCL